MNWKRPVIGALRKFGYELCRRGEPSTYTPCPPYGYFTYSPWFEGWFQDKYSGIREHTAVTEDRCYMLYRLAQRCAWLAGDFAECGVYRGGTAALLAQTLVEVEEGAGDQLLHLFDTFEGMPREADADPSSHGAGDFGDTSLAAVRERLAGFPFVRLHAGRIPDTFPAVGDRRFSFVHVDVDLYSSTRAAFEFFYPRTVPGGILVCDDYGAPAYVDAAKRAVDEFLADRAEYPISLGTGQCFVVKL